MQQYLYHRVPEGMRGTMLYPLNQLREIYPDLYDLNRKKYDGREEVLESRIPPPLDCLWNDALHFTAVAPTMLFKNIQEAGFDAETLVWKRWFKIPAEALDSENTIVCLYRRDISLVPAARDFYPFEIDRIPEYAKVPPETLAYYREQHAADKRPLFFHRVPHVLYKGTIDISAAVTVEAN